MMDALPLFDARQAGIDAGIEIGVNAGEKFPDFAGLKFPL